MRDLRVISVVLCMSFTIAFTSDGALEVPNGYVFEQLVGPPWTSLPIGFTWLPDGRFITIELSQGEDGDPCAAQDTGILGGDILRLDVSSMPGAGSGPPAKADITPAGNPYAGPDDNSRLIWAWGLRNPFRFTIDDVTGDLYIGDVGASSYEEMDHVPFATGGGENVGWPQREGPDPFICICGTCGSENPFTEPMYSYAHGVDPHSVIAGPYYRSVPDSANSLPSSLDGSVFFAEHFDGLRRLVFDGLSWDLAPPLPGQPSATNFAEGLFFISDIQLGPDGALYMMNISGGRGIYRIRRDPALDVPESVPTSLTLSARPNPVVAEGTTIRWSNATPGIVSVRILDAAGRHVRDLGSVYSAGTGSVHWDGRDEGDGHVQSGVYFYRVTTSAGDARSGKLVRIR